MDLISILKKLVIKENLSPSEMDFALNEILEGRAESAYTGAFLTALRMKGETIDEITTAVSTLKQKGSRLSLKNRDVIDIVGTGGDGASTFNISTATAFVVASGDVPVAKHGNVAASSLSGSADVLSALGAKIDLTPNQNEELLSKIGICFMFAPKFLPVLKNVSKIRKDIRIRNIFNCLGPLINPSGANYQLVGVYDKSLVLPCISVMKNLGVKGAMTLFGDSGLDEASVISDTHYARLIDGKIQEGTFSPTDYGIKLANVEELKGGTPELNAKIIKDIFKNKENDAKKDVVALNSAFSFLVINKVKTIEEGLNLAYSLIENGMAYEKLNQFIEGTNEYLR